MRNSARWLVIFGLLIALVGTGLAAGWLHPHPSDCPAYVGWGPDCDGSSGGLMFAIGALVALGGCVAVLTGWVASKRD